MEQTFGTYPCPACETNTVVRRKPRGAIPRCDDCLAKSVRGRLDRQRTKRQNGYDAHRDEEGRRYGETIPTCLYCGEPFLNKRQGAKDKCCDTCLPDHQDVLQARKEARKKTEPYRLVEKQGQRLRRLKRVGVDISWWEAHGNACGICGSADPKGRGCFHLDHDHSCCKKGCRRCFRGVLCHNCNVGLGNFKDDPKRLLAAVAWVQKLRPQAA